MVRKILLYLFLWIGSRYWNHVDIAKCKDHCVHHISFYDDEIKSIDYAIAWNNKAIAPEE